MLSLVSMPTDDWIVYGTQDDLLGDIFSEMGHVNFSQLYNRGEDLSTTSATLSLELNIKFSVVKALLYSERLQPKSNFHMQSKVWNWLSYYLPD